MCVPGGFSHLARLLYKIILNFSIKRYRLLQKLLTLQVVCRTGRFFDRCRKKQASVSIRNSNK